MSRRIRSVLTDVRQVDAEPQEEEAQTGQRKKPAKDGVAGVRLANVRNAAKGDLDDDAPERTTLLIDVHQEFGTHSSRSEGLHSPRTAISTGIGDRDDGDGDDCIENGRQTLDASSLDCKHEGRCLGVGTTGT